MLNIKTLLFASLFLVPTIHYGQHTDEINSNRPGESMSAFAVGKRVIQVEAGAFGIKESHSLQRYDADGFGIDMEIRYGEFLENLEFIGDIQYLNESVSSPMKVDEIADFKQSLLGAKYLIYDPNKGYKREANIYSWKANHKFNWHQVIPAVAVFAGANFTGEDNPFYLPLKSSISPKVALILQNHLGDGSWVFVGNVIYNYIGTDYPSLSYILTLTKGINQRWSAFLENQGIKSDFYSDVIARGGLAYLINRNLQADASFSTNFKDTPSIIYGGVGVSWRYDARHKDVILISNEEKQAEKVAKRTKTKKGFRLFKKN